MPTLVSPHADFERSYREYVAELGDGPRIPFTLKYAAEPFPALVEKLVNQSRGIGLENGFVPNSTFWLMVDGRLVAVSNLRHRLTPELEIIGGHIGYGVRPSEQGKGYGKEILRQTLLEARKIGINRALVTCDKSNLSSAKVITANGGKLESEEADPATGELIQRYWIAIAP